MVGGKKALRSSGSDHWQERDGYLVGEHLCRAHYDQRYTESPLFIRLQIISEKPIFCSDNTTFCRGLGRLTGCVVVLRSRTADFGKILQRFAVKKPKVNIMHGQ